MQDVSTKEKAIVKRGAGQQLDQLMGLKQERLKEMETRKNETESQLAIVESFKLYIEELTDKGSACAITQSARGLMDRMKELRKSQDEFNERNLTHRHISFSPSSTRVDHALIGSLGVTEGAQRDHMKLIESLQTNGEQLGDL